MKTPARSLVLGVDDCRFLRPGRPIALSLPAINHGTNGGSEKKSALGRAVLVVDAAALLP